MGFFPNAQCGCCGSTTPDCPCSPCNLPEKDLTITCKGGDAHGIVATGTLKYLGNCQWQSACILFTASPEFAYLGLSMQCGSGSVYFFGTTSGAAVHCLSDPIYSCDTDGSFTGNNLSILSYTCSPFHMSLGSAVFGDCPMFAAGIAELAYLYIDE